MQKVLRVSIAGLGDHAGQSHIEPLRSIPNAQIVAVCDPSEAARQRIYQDGFRGPLYSDLDQLLRDPQVDAVVVCSPDRFHALTLSRAIAAGKHVMVEKPVADSPGELRVVRAALSQAADAGLIVTSCHPRRFDPPYMWAKANMPRLIEQLGNPLEVGLDFFYHRPTKEGLHAGLLSDHMNHEIDALHYLFGHEPFTAHKLFDDQVRYAATGVRDDGIAFNFRGSRHLERRAYTDILTIRFERGTVEINTETGYAAITDYDTNQVSRAECGKTNYDLRFLGVNTDFVDACLEGRAPYLSADDLLVNTEAGIRLTHGASFRYHGPSGRMQTTANDPTATLLAIVADNAAPGSALALTARSAIGTTHAAETASGLFADRRTREVVKELLVGVAKTYEPNGQNLSEVLAAATDLFSPGGVKALQVVDAIATVEQTTAAKVARLDGSTASKRDFSFDAF